MTRVADPSPAQIIIPHTIAAGKALSEIATDGGSESAHRRHLDEQSPSRRHLDEQSPSQAIACAPAASMRQGQVKEKASPMATPPATDAGGSNGTPARVEPSGGASTVLVTARSSM